MQEGLCANMGYVTKRGKGVVAGKANAYEVRVSVCIHRICHRDVSANRKMQTRS